MEIGLAVRTDLSADPAAAAAGLERLWAVAPPPVRQLLRSERGLAQALGALFAGSEFLTEALLQCPEWVQWLAVERNRPTRAREEWAAALAGFTTGLSPLERPRGLMRFKRREYLRIALRDLEGRAGLAETTRELSDLADAVLQQAYVWSWNDWVAQYGVPRDGQGSVAELAVIALGKLGGGELNYSSDIDLMFAYSDEGRSSGGPASLSNAELFARMAQSLVRYVSTATGEGPAYRVDLRLRPGGREGEMAQSLPYLCRYYAGEAREWELQALLRSRGCAGAVGLARRLLDSAEPRIYPRAPEAAELAAGVQAARAAIQAQLEHHRATRRRSASLDVKLDAGGIRDVEFLTQYWQRLHGGADRWVRSGNTLLGLQRLHDARKISGAELQSLAGAYTLLRHVEHRAQLRLGQQTHTLPAHPERLLVLARSLRAAGVADDPLLPDPTPVIRARMAEVRELYSHYLQRRSPAAAAAPRTLALTWPEGVILRGHGQRQAVRLARSLQTWADEETGWSRLPLAALRRVALALDQSDWMAEMLIRRPSLAGFLADGESPLRDPPAEARDGLTPLRLWQQGHWLRLLVEEWENRASIQTTLRAQTQLAEATLRASLDLARAMETEAGRLGAGAASLAMLGLGRLGLGELDLLSDVDIVFVAEEPEREAAAALAARWIEVLTAYTQAGTLYAVDARLRPGGREGELVQTPAGLERYFAQRAGVWEAASYLKARLVAGHAPTATRALDALRAVLLTRWAGQPIGGGLLTMRERIAREGHPGHWGLKTVEGGYYDADFVIAERLLTSGRSGAGDAGLAEWARAGADLLPPHRGEEFAELVLYLRAADHALRVASGKAGAAVPGAGGVIERAWEWLRRIAPSPPAAAAGVAGEADRIAAVRGRMRALYRELLEQ